MKRIIFVKSAFAIFIISALLPARAQDIASTSFISPKATRVFDSATGLQSRVLMMNEVNINADRDFKKKYRLAENVVWMDGKNGTSVYFTYNGHKMRSTYNKAGKKEYTLKYYGESSMPANLRHLVKRNYYDHIIDLVTEVERNRTTYYLVKMHNQHEHLTVKVVDGELDVFERVGKQGKQD